MLTLKCWPKRKMTTRHQIEIIYSEYRNQCNVPGVTLLAEADGRTPHEIGEYKFRDVIEGFLHPSYRKDYLTLDKKRYLRKTSEIWKEFRA